MITARGPQTDNTTTATTGNPDPQAILEQVASRRQREMLIHKFTSIDGSWARQV